MKIAMLKAVKKVFIALTLESWELAEILEVGFNGEIYYYDLLEEQKPPHAILEDFNNCGENSVIIVRADRCTCSQKKGDNRYYKYLHNPEGPDEVHQCNEAGFQWKKVRKDIDRYPKQQSLFPIEIPEGFKKIYPPER